MGVDARTTALTLLALVAFASNSLLTRLALGSHQIEAASFVAVRLLAGAVVLALLVGIRARSVRPLRARGAVGPLALFAYAAPFSFAYLRIGAAAGALVLFGVVQLTMMGYGILRGERPSGLAWVGIALAIVGFAVLTVPAASRPDLIGVALMGLAGVAWGVYSLNGRSTADPLTATARSFIWSTPLALLLVLVTLLMTRAPTPPTSRGFVLAVISGGVTSGVGYAIWYRALPRLSVTQAAVAQLSVPVIAAVGGGMLLHERLTLRLLLSGAAILGGVALVLTARSRGRR